MSAATDPANLPRPQYTVDLPRVRRAAAAIAPHGLFRTAVVHSPELSRLSGRPVHLKCENRQRTGSFKVRGALARLTALSDEERRRGVIASSAGNHGLGVAWAGRVLGVPGLVVVPRGAARVKLERLRQMLIKVREHGAGYDEAERHARALAASEQATFISPFDDPWIVAGNGGTVGQEIVEQLPGCSAIVAPVGGGGLAAGLAVGADGVPVVGINTAASPAMFRSLTEGRVLHSYDAEPTLCDGLEGGVSDNSVGLCGRLLHGVEVVEERAIAEAIRLLARGHGMVVEGSAAVGVAALLERKALPGDGPICVVLSGRNIDHQRLQTILARC